MNPHIFRENDVRGHAERELDDATVTALGGVLGRRAARVGVPLLIGRDGRAASPRLLAALSAGARRHADVLDLGVVPTPLVSFAAHTAVPADRAVAVMITGSHNPAEENGFKITAEGASLHGQALLELRDQVSAELGTPSLASAHHAMHELDLREPYLDAIVGSLRLGPRRFPVALDAGNGVAGPLACPLLQRLGFPFHPIYCEIDGSFPHHHPDPTVAENLRDLGALVETTGAALGLGFDGDGDRLGVLDARGRIVWGDQLLVLLGRALLAEVPGARILAEVKCSQVAFDCLAAAGGQVEMWKVGHSRLKARMKETGALFAGEMSGHFFFAHRWPGFDDGLYAAARLLELLSHTSESLADLVDALPTVYNTPELRLPCPDHQKAAVVAAVAARLRAHPQVRSVIELDGIRATFEGGWALLRPSTTQPLLVARYEAQTPERLTELRTLMEQLLGDPSGGR